MKRKIIKKKTPYRFLTCIKILAVFLMCLEFKLGYSQKFNPHEFTFNGYIRTGIGRTDGEQMVDFVTPENVHKFRMGNEANHYSELQFNYRYKNKDSVNLYEVTYMMSKYIPYGSDDYKDFPETAQLYGKINKVINGADIWMGKRYYDRRNIEALDYFWLNSAQNSQVGIGIENYKIKNSGNLNLAFMEFSYPANPDYYSYVADLRYLDIPLTEHSKVNLVGQLSSLSKNKEANRSGHSGYGIGGWWTYSKGNISHTSSIIFRKGSSVVANGYTGKTVSEYNDATRIYDLGKANTLDITHNFVYDDKIKNAVQAIMTYQYNDYGVGNIDSEGMILDHKRAKNWFSIGFRYLYYINKHFNLALEAGNDYMKSSKLGIEGSLQKITFSPQITWNYGYYSRPVIRPFVTYAHWSDSFRGITGVSSFNTKLKNKNQGFTAGLQLEVWW
ncbi:carbohydrate porin [Chryseobacterium sp. CT-SW4]|uniref:carbohydrate porin n=1 Tax=Chryseobacterium sp. SW-1 TaxID=3157343 RepID=UPI003B02948E